MEKLPLELNEEEPLRFVLVNILQLRKIEGFHLFLSVEKSEKTVIDAPSSRSTSSIRNKTKTLGEPSSTNDEIGGNNYNVKWAGQGTPRLYIALHLRRPDVTNGL